MKERDFQKKIAGDGPKAVRGKSLHRLVEGQLASAGEEEGLCRDLSAPKGAETHRQ